MQLVSILIGALFASGLHAAPVADGTEQSVAIDENQLFKRSGQSCRVLADRVNCRTGPGTNYRSAVQLSSSWTRGYWFTCVKSGQCITLNGAVNCEAWALLILLPMFDDTVRKLLGG
ncbi:hypothetical protein N7535_005691 [Penicillium sp. DV-2018c]|nr:hypothetical protein N7461_009264 [Penicillium sp. DV-2018c]KAJ5572031.1 hypothetical protein N7535_005691 [Penicillium sp. DV-2018c]